MYRALTQRFQGVFRRHVKNQEWSDALNGVCTRYIIEQYILWGCESVLFVYKWYVLGALYIFVLIDKEMPSTMAEKGKSRKIKWKFPGTYKDNKGVQNSLEP